MRKLIPVLMLAGLFLIGVGGALAQSSVQIFFVACDTTAVMNLTGTMEAGLDVYYQVYSGAGATGTPITSLRRVQVDGAYAFSEVVNYNSGTTVPTAAIASAKVFIASESNSNSLASEVFVVDDLQDGCNTPQNALGTSSDAGTATTTTTSSGSNILSPFGGFINPNISSTPEPIVVIGARTQTTSGRSATPGVIFAECDEFLPGAAPGLLYDTDNLTIFWSWFARTPEQVQDHIAQAVYEVSLNRAPLINVQVSDITRPLNRNYWVFYTANIGRLRPGGYGIEFKLSWKQAIFDGYDDFGPGTATERMESTCTFRIEPNPDGQVVTDHNLMYSVR